MSIFVTIDGPNGVGKTSYISTLKEMLGKNYRVFTTKEPSNTEFGQYVKQCRKLFTKESYAFLIAAERCLHIDTIILPALKQNDIVICDRYIPSSLVLQQYDGVEVEQIWNLNKTFLKPDISIILIADEKELTIRLNERNQLTYFEEVMERQEEVKLFKNAHTYLQEKGFKSLLLENTFQEDFKRNIRLICDMIELEMEKNNG